MTQEEAEKIADKIVLEVCELSDRTSPDDWPEALLVTADELAAIVMPRILSAHSRGHKEGVGAAAQWHDQQAIECDKQEWPEFAENHRDYAHSIRALLPASAASKETE